MNADATNRVESLPIATHDTLVRLAGLRLLEGWAEHTEALSTAARTALGAATGEAEREGAVYDEHWSGLPFDTKTAIHAVVLTLLADDRCEPLHKALRDVEEDLGERVAEERTTRTWERAESELDRQQKHLAARGWTVGECEITSDGDAMVATLTATYRVPIN